VEVQVCGGVDVLNSVFGFRYSMTDYRNRLPITEKIEMQVKSKMIAGLLTVFLSSASALAQTASPATACFIVPL
jgi:hypothetical protein